MKHIAILLFDIINNIGGILPFVENLKAGLSEIGCKPEIICAEYRNDLQSMAQRESHGVKTDIGLILRMWNDFAPRAYPDSTVAVPYKGPLNSELLRERLSEYDGVIIASGIPSMRMQRRNMKNNLDWVRVLQHGKPMVAVVHDCHWKGYARTLLKVRDKLTAVVGVHPASYNSLADFPAMRACIVNPFDILNANKPLKREKEDWVCCCSYFKRWKHLEDGLRAAPYLHPIRLFYMGGGVEYSYMIAKIKPREEYKGTKYDAYVKKIEYYYWKEGDPSCQKEWIGMPIWKLAKVYGFKHLGFKHGEDVHHVQKLCKGLVDFSWHPDWGEHFNRVLVEAMINRCLPFARPLGISGNKGGVGRVFGPDNVVLIPEDASPKRIADIMKSSLADKQLMKDVIRRNLHKIGIFNRKSVAMDYIALLEGRDAGLLPIREGKPTKEVEEWIQDFDIVHRFPRTRWWPRLAPKKSKRRKPK